MTTTKLIAYGALVVGVGAVALVVARPPEGETAVADDAGAVTALTAMDYIEIQQLVARYGFALDTGAEDGYMWADLFAPGGTFNDTAGRDELAKLARGGRRGPLNVRNYSAAAIIKPSADGATGIQYAQAINLGERGRGTSTELDHFGRYEDVYVKTEAGWRFQSRLFINESGSLRPPAERASSADASPAR